jgi:hypothetical protein
MVPADKLAGVLASLPTIKVASNYARDVPLRDLMGIKDPAPPPGTPIIAKSPDFLWMSKASYRYTLDGTYALYLGEGENTAAAEAKQHPGTLGFDYTPRAPVVTFHVHVIASAVLDLTAPAIQAALKVTTADLVKNWRLKSPNSIPQKLGAAIFAAGRFEGIRYVSAAQARVKAEGKCLVIFRDRRQAGSKMWLEQDGVFSQEL